MAESARDTLIGGFAGSVEVTIMQPTIAVKNALQEARPVELSPKALYRGYGINVGTMAPITASYFGAISGYRQLFTNVMGRKPKGSEAVACSMAGGASSALLAGPAELLVIQQQRAGISAREAFHYVWGGYGLQGLYKGTLATAARDGTVLAGLMGMCPVIVETLNETESTQKLPSGVKLAIGSVVSGIVGTAFSMPFDAIKTLQQANLDKEAVPQYATIRSTGARIFEQGGVVALYSGSFPRGFRIIAATFILNSVKDWAYGILEKVQD